jgi:N-acetylglutamate synthase-like GNAT family acetyltransferase
MTTPNPQVRRATIEDLPKLVVLWQQENLACPDLEKRFKEFQVVEAPPGEIAAALGLQIAGHEGRLHSEVFARPEESDALRGLLWERTRVLAQNHGLARLWTQLSTPFWSASGFRYAPPDTLAKLPPPFNDDAKPWQFLQLKDDTAPVSIDKEFAMFKEMEKEKTEKMLRHAKVLKLVAAGLVVLVFVVVLVGFLAWFKTRAQLHR